MTTEYEYRLDRKTGYRTAMHLVVFAALAVVLLYVYDGGYILAWFISIMVAVIGLMILSIPRKIVLTDNSLDILCISDFTEIPYGDIVSARAVDGREMRLFLPLFASAGFFGYYGYFLNLRRMDLVKVYASSWHGFVEITDIYEDKYYVSCDRCDELVAMIAERTANEQKDVQ